MALFKCKMCGGALEFSSTETVGICEYCGTKQTLPRLDDEKKTNLYDRANHFRRNNEFDKAANIYEQILMEDREDSEAYWSLVLCQYGIEYVEDPETHKRVPTVNRTQFTSIFDDDNYKMALQYADSNQKSVYEEEADTINNIQKGILAISQGEEPFDIFICYKESDESGKRTRDSVLANDLYHQLQMEGFKVFFARITLEDKIGTAYEPYIFAALNSAKVMVVLGTKPEYFKAVWVKNEWSRYLSLVKKSNGKKVLIPAYKDMDPYDLPEEFSHLQALDMSKLGFMQDLIRGIKKIVREDEQKPVVRETVTVGSDNSRVEPLLKRAYMFLEDGDWEKADSFFEQVLNLDPENAKAYVGKLMAELHVHKQDELGNCNYPIESNNNYQKAIRFADAGLASTLKGYTENIQKRIENDRLQKIYDNALAKKNSNMNRLEVLQQAVKEFRSISGFKDADQLADQLEQRCAVLEKDRMYDEAIAMMSGSINQCTRALEIFEQISGWKDADEKKEACRVKIAELREKEEKDRLEKERLAEEARVKAEKRLENKKKLIRILRIAIPASIVLCIVLVSIFRPIAIRKKTYKNASDNLRLAENNEQYAKMAYDDFSSLGDYKDSKEKAEKAHEYYNNLRYEDGIAALKEKDWTRARDIFAELGDYKESQTKLSAAQEEIDKLDKKYDSAQKNMDAGKYKKAFLDFESLGTYRDSYDKMCEARDLMAKDIQSANEGDYILFGNYEQNADHWGDEPIVWEVDKTGTDDSGSQYLRIVTHSVLEYKPYDENGQKDWEVASLRTWLNGSFMNTSFSEDERKAIGWIRYNDYPDIDDQIGLEWELNANKKDTPYVAEKRKGDKTSGYWVFPLRNIGTNTQNSNGVRIFMYIFI